MKKKRKWTPEERAAWEAARDARLDELRRHIARIEAELAERRRARGQDAQPAS
jgi:hypothetical protein